MRVLITAGPTHEPIDPVRYIGNRSSGKMGAALAQAAIKAGHFITVILGPVAVPMPAGVSRVDVMTAAEMHQAVLTQFPRHDLLILAAAVADFRPTQVSREKLPRHGTLTIECVATEDIALAAGKFKLPHQRTIGFALESDDNLTRARQKLFAKHLDLIVFNPLSTLDSPAITPTLLYPDGRTEPLASASKGDFADILLQKSVELWN
jgi:phosphopantothenoylcysteine decarboxylase / phosphopantothenate---cysteine ligase